MFFDTYYLILVVPAILVSMWASAKVNSTFNRYSKVHSSSGMTGAQIARRILDENGLQHVGVEAISGNLTDHYDPRDRVVRLSDPVYGSTSVAAIGVAAHETGHAVQDARNYTPMKIRAAIIPVTNIGAKLSMPLILIGFLMGADPLVQLGILAFSLMTLFQLVTLPVEFNASSRALATLEGDHILYGEEAAGAKKVLTAAALTYVAALLVSAMQLLRLVLLFNRRRD